MRGVGKMYKMFPSRLDNFLDAVGLAGLIPGRGSRHSEFWALRGVDLDLPKGSRIGIIGPNGAGKTTLLRLIAGALSPTEGAIDVQGRVQALFHAGTAFHPEFTGYENIQAALTLEGLSRAQIAESEKDIAEFTELGDFLGQPLKSYSSGMQARLAFATATVVKPEILIVDEILGVGDAYFFRKSSERMRELIDAGATLLLVSHAMDQVMMLCDRALWLDRGRVIHLGPSSQVAKAYMRHMDTLSDRRLRAKNRRRRYSGYSAAEEGNYADHLVAEIRVSGPSGARCDVAELTIWEGGEVYERLLVGFPQDASTGQVTFVILESSDWSSPRMADVGFCRAVAVPTGDPRQAVGSAVCYFYAMVDEAEYVIELTYRRDTDAEVSLTVSRNGAALTTTGLEGEPGVWTTQRVGLDIAASETVMRRVETLRVPVTRWPGEGSLLVESVALVDGDGAERSRFPAGGPMTVIISGEARKAGTFPVTPAVTLFRTDGLLISNHVGEQRSIFVVVGDRFQFRLKFARLNLGDGSYVLSVGLFRELIPNGSSKAYDLIGLSFEFQVAGNAPFDNGVFSHPSEWEYARLPAPSARPPEVIIGG